MKRYIWIMAITLLFTGLIGCDDEDYAFYKDGYDSIYFGLPEEQQDSMTISLAKYLTSEIEVKIPLEIAGYTSTEPRKYKISVVKDSTTAVENLHYKNFSGEHTFRADSYFDTLTIKLYPNDPELFESSKRLYFRLEPTDYLASGINYKQWVDLRFTNELIMPKIWNTFYSSYFGSYSRVKYAHCLSHLKLDEMPDINDGDPAKWDAYGMVMNQYFIDRIVLDENNMQILPWR